MLHSFNVGMTTKGTEMENPHQVVIIKLFLPTTVSKSLQDLPSFQLKLRVARSVSSESLLQVTLSLHSAKRFCTKYKAQY